MPKESSQEVPSENVVETGSSREQVLCQKCGSQRVHRVHREGFLQLQVYPRFGYYPWSCKTCGALVMLRKRRRHRRGEKADRPSRKSS